MVPLPTGQDVANFLDETVDADLAGRHVTVITAMARRYVRGNGFGDGTVEADLAAVILTATARLAVNPDQLVTEQVGELATRYTPFLGWTLAETFVLNDYRGRAG